MLTKFSFLLLLFIFQLAAASLAAGDLGGIAGASDSKGAVTGAELAGAEGQSDAQPGGSSLPEEDWNRTFGGNYGDGAWCLQETDDGGFILAGNTASRGEGSDLLLLRTDGNGSIVWSRTWGGSGEDAGYFAKQTSDGGFIVTGSTGSFGMGAELLWLLKTDGNGSLLWDRTFGGFVSSSGDGGWSVDETGDGGYIVAGYTQSLGSGRKDLWMLRTDGNGSRLWEKTFGGQGDDVGMSVLESRDGGFIVAGRTGSFGRGGDDMWLLKTDFQGVEIWNETIGGKQDDAAFQVVETEDGFALSGRTESGSEGRRVALVRVNGEGKKMWQKEYEGSSAASLALTLDGGFILAGRLDSEETGRDALLIKTDSSGREQWSMVLDGCGGDEIGTFVVQCRDGSYALAGITNSCGQGAEDAWLVKIQAEETPQLVAEAAENGVWNETGTGGSPE
jgi:hypothetical protein